MLSMNGKKFDEFDFSNFGWCDKKKKKQDLFSSHSPEIMDKILQHLGPMISKKEIDLASLAYKLAKAGADSKLVDAVRAKIKNIIQRKFFFTLALLGSTHTIPPEELNDIATKLVDIAATAIKKCEKKHKS